MRLVWISQRVLVLFCAWEKVKIGGFAIRIEQLMAVDFMVLLIDCYTLLLVVCLIMVVCCSYMLYVLSHIILYYTLTDMFFKFISLLALG